MCVSKLSECDAIFVPVISPFRDSRLKAKELLSPGFYEIYCDAKIDSLVRRDTKGLYALARKGEIDNLIGMSDKAPYEAPDRPDLRINTSDTSQSVAINQMVEFVSAKLGWEQR